jgi:ribosomal-protein-alanine N-acetyltransferase
MVLEGERCRVRPWRKDDIPSLVLHANNLNVARQLRDRFPHPYTRGAAQAFLKATQSADPCNNFAIEVAGEAVGGIGYVPGTDVERYSAEVGYWLGEAYWGRGVVTEALTMLTDHAFAELKLLRLFALPFEQNVGSIRVLEHAGYVREGVLRASSVKYGEPRNQVLYAKVNPSWLSSDTR